MSGSGTNTVKLLERQKQLEAESGSPFTITTIVTDNDDEKNNAWKIGKEFGIKNIFFHNFKNFKKTSIKDSKNLKEREPYFAEIVAELTQKVSPKIEVIALAGYGLIVTDPLLSRFAYRIINVHPADLSIHDACGKPKYAGSHAVRDAILGGETEIRASTHIVNAGVDLGSVLLISEPVKIALPEGMTLEELRKEENLEIANTVADEHQNRLKSVGDHKIFPLTLELMAKGSFSVDESNVVHLNGRSIPNGCRMEELSK